MVGTSSETGVDKGVGGAVEGLARRTATELVCAAVDGAAKLGLLDDSIADVALLDLARQIRLKPDGRASRHIDHFLFGGGEEIVFSTGLLLNSDAGVRKRVSESITANIFKNPRMMRPDEKRMSGGAYRIAVRQSDYADDDWKNALGGFIFQWEIADLSSDKTRVFATVWGANEYQWHPAAKRTTQCIHEAGDRLTKSKTIRARNFWMVATPTIIVVATGKPLVGSL